MTANPQQEPEYSRRKFILERAKSGRSECRGCAEKITKDSLRVGLVTYRPHKTIQWHHLNPSCISCSKLSSKPEQLNAQETVALEKFMAASPSVVRPVSELVSGPLSMNQLAHLMTRKHGKFRSFSFGLEDKLKYSENWNWRCLISTILVCNTRESGMLKLGNSLFKMFPDPESLVLLKDDAAGRRIVLKDMEDCKLKHGGRKLDYIIGASEVVLKNGGVPKSKAALQSIKGVGHHVASVVLSWTGVSQEFGVDVHVERIMKRLGMMPEKESPIETELRVKSEVDPEIIGHFSRSFVDFGQAGECAYVPACEDCWLRKTCPTGRRYTDSELDW